MLPWQVWEPVKCRWVKWTKSGGTDFNCGIGNIELEDMEF